jgi:NTE family protein
MSAMTELFNDPHVAPLLQKVHVVGGGQLYSRDDPAEAVFLLRQGLLAVMRPGSDNRDHLIGYVRAGEYVGEMAVLAGAPRTGTVVALRDCVVDAMPAGVFLERLAERPTLAAELAATVVTRARGDAATQPRAQLILIAAIDHGTDPMKLAMRLAQACNTAGIKATAFDQAAVGDDPHRIDRAEETHTLILLAARHDEARWLDICRRQVDRIILLGRAERSPPLDCSLCMNDPHQASQLIDLALERTAGSRSRSGHAWLAATNAAQIFHVDDKGGGVSRLARILTGTSVGLALSGGGARAFAHIGAVRALREAKVEIDLVCGTSMGAIIAAGVATGWDDDELDAHMRAAFVASNPLDDIAFPMVAMTRGGKVTARLAEHFADIDIADLNTPFFCVSADLTAGRSHVHDRGLLAQALRASISLPGILPPVIDGDRVLVDGGALRNLPTDLLRSRHGGTVIGSDVSRAAGLTPSDVMLPPSWFKWIWSGAWRRGPPIVSILMRSATIGSGTEIAAARDAADLYVMPDTGMIEIRDWRAYPQAVDAGYRTMRDALAALDAPVSQLRFLRATSSAPAR